MAGRRESVTLKDVAMAADVSIATVSYVLNNTDNAINAETRARVLEVARQMNYRPNRAAKGLKTSHFNTVAVVVEDFRSFFIQGLIDGVCQCTEERGYDVVLMNLRLDSRISHSNHYETNEFNEYAKGKISNIEQMQVDGLIYIGAFYHDIRDMLCHITLPIVYLYSFSSVDIHHSSVHYDDYRAAYEATQRLLRAGHRRIGHIAGTLDSTPGQERIFGWRRALADAGIDAADEWFASGDFDAGMAYEAAMQMLRADNRPTAVFVASDLMAKGVYDACMQLGLRIPQDLSVVGFDNADFSSYFSPALTTMAMPVWKMGYQAAKMLLAGEEGAQNVRLACTLVERGSVTDISE